MSALTEKIALRRMLQNVIHRLDEAIDDLMTAEKNVPVPCRFYDDHIVAWKNRQHVFSASTFTLLKQFFDAPAMMLSKEDVRQDVLRDEEAKEGSVRQCILCARKEIERFGFPYRIETITRKGYRLVKE